MGFSFFLAPILIGVMLNQDKQVFGPFMIGRPLVAGFLIGLLLDAAKYGIWLGLSVELLWLATMPLGGQIIPNAGLAVSTVLSAWVASDFYTSTAVPKETGMVLIFLLTPIWARAFTAVDIFCRHLATKASLKARQELEDGHDPHFFKVNFWGYLTNLSCSFAASITGFVITLIFLNIILTAIPVYLFGSLGFLFNFVPFVGLLIMAVSLPRSSLPYYIAGLMASLLAISAI